MKKALATLLALALCLGMVFVPASAAATAEVYVTISSAGTLAAAYEKITVTDIDQDGALTINDALYCAHEALYEGGAAAGYGSGETEYGLSMNKLWGVENGGSYGYYVNNASAWSLTDPVESGDHVYAFSYSDLTAWSDAYSYFNVDTVATACGESVTLTLTYNSGYDESWNRLFDPCAGATVTVDGKEYTTDAEGKVTLTFDKAGAYTVTASSDTVTLVPPVCVVTVRTFADTVDSWAADEIERVIAKGLFNGSGSRFAPQMTMSRAMLVTVLYRLDGSPVVSAENEFTDVASGAYYADAVIWADANGIVEGNGSGSFYPDAEVSRQQIATILYRYAQYKGYDVSPAADLSGYGDASAVSDWALDAMKWANASGLITGTNANLLLPGSSATREQVAVILDRFSK